MSFSLIPRMSIGSIYDLKPEMLTKQGISLLMMDLDNTLIPYSQSHPTEKMHNWIESFRQAGIELYIVSNTKTDRAKVFSAAAQMEHVKRARKPSTKKLREIMVKLGKKPEESAMIGDQIFTDVLAANRCNVLSIIVRPISMKKRPHFAARYVIELPFRALSKEIRKSDK